MSTPPQLQERLDRVGWIGVDLDGTLAFYGKWTPWNVIGDPVPRMMERVKGWVAAGKDVRIVTARVFPYIHGNEISTRDAMDRRTCIVNGDYFSVMEMVAVVQLWTLEHAGKALPVTCAKDYDMIELWDDRTVQVIPNTGRTIQEDFDARLLRCGAAWPVRIA